MLLRLRQFSLALGGIAFVTAVGAVIAGADAVAQPAGVLAAVGTAIGLGALPALRAYQYTGWIIAAVIAAMVYPSAFLTVGDFDMRSPWLILLVVQLVMFGMGTQMSLADLRGVGTHPRGVLIGLLCQFSIMPVVGFTLTKIFHFPVEIAAGIILIGSCSSGLASNVMAYLARANLVLSVTVTSVATLAAPIMTPFLMQVFAGTLIEIAFIGMMVQITKIVLVPIGAAMLHDYLKRASATGWRRAFTVAGVSAVWLLFLLSGGAAWLHGTVPESVYTTLELLGFFAGAVLAGLAYHFLTLRFRKLDSVMPYFSMAGIVYFTLVTTAAGRDHLLEVGFLLFLAAVLHNTSGYFFGYWLSRAFGLDRSSARTMALEVGLQNGGMASGLAGAMGKLGTVGLAAAVFSPWMNISGSILANYWSKRPPK
ncbi:MAG: bile acid:sodium symporter family protein [Opitutales bacterium]|nr:bile acid:sodium symporter family protein [Opitutales bacterium]